MPRSTVSILSALAAKRVVTMKVEVIAIGFLLLPVFPLHPALQHYVQTWPLSATSNFRNSNFCKNADDRAVNLPRCILTRFIGVLRQWLSTTLDKEHT